MGESVIANATWSDPKWRAAAEEPRAPRAAELSASSAPRRFSLRRPAHSVVGQGARAHRALQQRRAFGHTLPGLKETATAPADCGRSFHGEHALAALREAVAAQRRTSVERHLTATRLETAMHVKTWHVAVFIDEEEDQTHTRAELTTDANVLTGHGIARRRASDSDVPEIGDELSTARALADLANQLLEAGAADLEGVMHEHVTLTS
jgi:hypothetical protein